MKIRSEREGGHCKIDLNGQDKDHKTHRQLLFEKHKLQKTTVVQDIVYTGGQRPGVDLTLRRKLLQNEKHRCLRICWERILPQHCLRVLLVEGDNSTRHVISALLLHFSYDDFLIKPVRKNELRNIWKHIWKRRQNSTINGCGSSIYNRPQKPARLQLDAGSEKNNEINEKSNTVLGARKTQKAVRLQAASRAGDNMCNYKSETASSDFKVGDGGDKGSGTQVSI